MQWLSEGESRPQSVGFLVFMDWVLKEVGIPDQLTCLQRNLYAGQETTARTERGTMDWFKTGKGVRQGCILSLCLFNL